MNFKIKSLEHFLPSFLGKNGNLEIQDFSPLLNRVLSGVLAPFFQWILLKVLGEILAKRKKKSQIMPPFKDGLIFGFFASMNSRGVPACATFWLSLCSAFCALYFSLEVLGTIHKLRQHIFFFF